MPQPFRTRQSSSRGTATIPREQGSNYAVQGSGLRRHEFVDTLNVLGTAIAVGAYKFYNMLEFHRTFGGAGEDDTNPTATALNNYQSVQVMNGSKLANYESKIYITNPNSDVGVWIDIYEIITSFYDAHIFDTLQTANCPVTFETVDNNPDNRGIVEQKSPHITLTENNLKNSVFAQRFLRLKQRVFVDRQQGAGGSVVIRVNGIPPKCRRSQTGMFWGLLFHVNESLNVTPSNIGINRDVSFIEYPTADRLPYLT